jgi:hypothetical protein
VGGGGGTGKVSMQDFHFTDVPQQYRFADGSVRFLTVAVGYEIVNVQGAVPRSIPLPRNMILTTEIEQGGTRLLLPAVQKVREAAAH